MNSDVSRQNRHHYALAVHVQEPTRTSGKVEPAPSEWNKTYLSDMILAVAIVN